MNRRERVTAALRHSEVRPVPFSVGFTQQEHDKVAAYLGDAGFTERINNHISSTYYDGHLREIRPDYWQDDFGVLWNRTGADKDIGVIEGIVIPEPDMSGYVFPEIDREQIHREYQALMARPDDTFKFGSIGFSLFERAWTLRGMENLLTDMVLEPDFVDSLLQAILTYNLQIIDIALQHDIDGFHFGDDWGQQKGLIMGPQYWRRFIKPVLAVMYGRVRSTGKFVSQHSCGDIHEILPDLIDIGLNVYQTVQPEIYDLPALKREYGRDLSFWGCISTQRLLPFATPDEVRRVTGETLRLMGSGGGYIAAPTHSIPGDVPPENVMAMLEILHDQP
ncbi:MAG: uroporphyrinogen decarboxylase family protein [Bacillota bacterium]|nr:uroporphyrinogen decarboxylase family protein [Bacillota bacterium]